MEDETTGTDDVDHNRWLRDSTTIAGPCRICGADVTVLGVRVRGGVICERCWKDNDDGPWEPDR